jgi:hypothetical protein
MARHRDDCAAVLVIFDSDDDAACELGPSLARIAENIGLNVPTCVVLAVREIESWLIAGAISLRGYRGVPEDLSPPENVETIRGAKEWLDQRLPRGYKPTIDLQPLILRFDYEAARVVSPSLDKFLRDVQSLLDRLRDA